MRKREQKELAAATAKLALSYGHSSLAEAYIGAARPPPCHKARQSGSLQPDRCRRAWSKVFDVSLSACRPPAACGRVVMHPALPAQHGPSAQMRGRPQPPLSHPVCVPVAEQVVTDRTSDAARIQNALLRSKVEEDSRQEQEIYRSSRRGASERSSRAAERSGGPGSEARSHTSCASTSAVEQPSSHGQAVSPVRSPNRLSSTSGRNRLQTTSLDSMVSGASALGHRDGSKTSAFLARAESVLASQRRPDSEPLTPGRSQRVRCCPCITVLLFRRASVSALCCRPYEIENVVRSLGLSEVASVIT